MNGSSSPPGPGVGGGIYSSGAGTALNLTLAANSVSGAPATSTGGNLAVVGGQFSLRNTILANSPAGGNCSGTATDAGHNLSSDATCHFSAPGSMNSVDPKLGGLEANGGPTPTLALLPQSPAIDSGDDTNCPATDQRGVSRPQRLHCDIGAYELDGSPYRITYLGRIAPERVVVLGVGPPGRTVTAQSSSDFVHWTDLGSAVVSPTGAFEIQGTADRSTRFYRATGLGF